MMNAEKLKILYNALREGKYIVETLHYSNNEKYKNAIELEKEGYLKIIPSKTIYAEKFKLTSKGRKYIKEYNEDVKHGDKLPYYMLV